MANRRAISSAEREAKAKAIREQEEQRKQERLAQLHEVEARERERQRALEQARLRVINEKKERERQRRAAFEERRRQLKEQDEIRKQSIKAKIKDDGSANRRKDKPIYAFGSSTPRVLSYLEGLNAPERVYSTRLRSRSRGGGDSFSRDTGASSSCLSCSVAGRLDTPTSSGVPATPVSPLTPSSARLYPVSFSTFNLPKKAATPDRTDGPRIAFGRRVSGAQPAPKLSSSTRSIVPSPNAASRNKPIPSITRSMYDQRSAVGDSDPTHRRRVPSGSFASSPDVRRSRTSSTSISRKARTRPQANEKDSAAKLAGGNRSFSPSKRPNSIPLQKRPPLSQRKAAGSPANHELVPSAPGIRSRSVSKPSPILAPVPSSRAASLSKKPATAANSSDRSSKQKKSAGSEPLPTSRGTHIGNTSMSARQKPPSGVPSKPQATPRPSRHHVAPSDNAAAVPVEVIALAHNDPSISIAKTSDGVANAVSVPVDSPGSNHSRSLPEAENDTLEVPVVSEPSLGPRQGTFTKESNSLTLTPVDEDRQVEDATDAESVNFSDLDQDSLNADTVSSPGLLDDAKLSSPVSWDNPTSPTITDSTAHVDPTLIMSPTLDQEHLMHKNLSFGDDSGMPLEAISSQDILLEEQPDNLLNLSDKEDSIPSDLGSSIRSPAASNSDGGFDETNLRNLDMGSNDGIDDVVQPSLHQWTPSSDGDEPDSSVVQGMSSGSAELTGYDAVALTDDQDHSNTTEGMTPTAEEAPKSALSRLIDRIVIHYKDPTVSGTKSNASFTQDDGEVISGSTPRPWIGSIESDSVEVDILSHEEAALLATEPSDDGACDGPSLADELAQISSESSQATPPSTQRLQPSGLASQFALYDHDTSPTKPVSLARDSTTSAISPIHAGTDVDSQRIREDGAHTAESETFPSIPYYGKAELLTYTDFTIASPRITSEPPSVYVVSPSCFSSVAGAQGIDGSFMFDHEDMGAKAYGDPREADVTFDYLPSVPFEGPIGSVYLTDKTEPLNTNSYAIDGVEDIQQSEVPSEAVRTPKSPMDNHSFPVTMPDVPQSELSPASSDSGHIYDYMPSVPFTDSIGQVGHCDPTGLPSADTQPASITASELEPFSGVGEFSNVESSHEHGTVTRFLVKNIVQDSVERRFSESPDESIEETDGSDTPDDPFVSPVVVPVYSLACSDPTAGLDQEPVTSSSGGQGLRDAGVLGALELLDDNDKTITPAEVGPVLETDGQRLAAGVPEDRNGDGGRAPVDPDSLLHAEVETHRDEAGRPRNTEVDPETPIAPASDRAYFGEADLHGTPESALTYSPIKHPERDTDMSLKNTSNTADPRGNEGIKDALSSVDSLSGQNDDANPSEAGIYVDMAARPSLLPVAATKLSEKPVIRVAERVPYHEPAASDAGDGLSSGNDMLDDMHEDGAGQSAATSTATDSHINGYDLVDQEPDLSSPDDDDHKSTPSLISGMARVVSQTPTPTGERKVLSAEEAKTALAEKRREARELLEAAQRKEEARRLAEEEAFRRKVAEEERVAEELRKAEQQRLRAAIEEQAHLEKEAAARREAEEKTQLELLQKQKEAAEKAEKEKQDREQKRAKEEQDRLDRKKRLEAIMSRTRKSGSPSDNRTPSPNSASSENNNGTITQEPQRLSAAATLLSGGNREKSAPNLRQQSPSASVLARIAQDKPEVRKSLENLMNKVRAASDGKPRPAANGLMTTSMIADTSLEKKGNMGEHSGAANTMSMSMYDKRVSESVPDLNATEGHANTQGKGAPIGEVKPTVRYPNGNPAALSTPSRYSILTALTPLSSPAPSQLDIPGAVPQTPTSPLVTSATNARSSPVQTNSLDQHVPSVATSPGSSRRSRDRRVPGETGLQNGVHSDKLWPHEVGLGPALEIPESGISDIPDPFKSDSSTEHSLDKVPLAADGADALPSSSSVFHSDPFFNSTLDMFDPFAPSASTQQQS